MRRLPDYAPVSSAPAAFRAFFTKGLALSGDPLPFITISHKHK
jgi:hypothetical protein